jgi:hypothetical protein
VYTPFSNYVDDSRGTVTTYFTLNGTLVGAYSYQKGNEASTGKITFAHTNYLGTPVIETDDKGDIVEMDITDVYGNYVQRDQRNDNAYHDKELFLERSLRKKRRHISHIARRRHRQKHIPRALCIRPKRHDLRRRLPHLDRRDHLHGSGDFSRILHTLDPPNFSSTQRC